MRSSLTVEELKRRRRSCWIDGLVCTLAAAINASLALSDPQWWPCWVLAAIAFVLAIVDALAIGVIEDSIKLVKGDRDAQS